MPKVFSPRSASPESFSRMRRKDAFLVPGTRSFSPGGRARRGADAMLLLRARGLDLLADLEAGEAPDHDVLLDGRDLLRDELADRDLGVLHEGLLEQAEVGVVLL